MTARSETRALPEARLGDRLGRGSVVLAVVTVQVVAFAAAFAAEEATLYALFALGSAATLVGATAGGWRAVGAAAVGTALTGAVGWLLGYVWMIVAGPVLLTAAVGPAAGGSGRVGAGVGAATLGTALLAVAGELLAAPFVLVLGPAFLAAVVGRVDGEWADVAAATLGTVLLIAVGLPLAGFVARQEFGVVAEKLVQPEVHRMLYLSMYGPLLAALFTLAFGVPLAYLLARGFPGQSLVESLVDLPLIVPHSVAGLLILFGFGEGAAFPSLPILGSMPGLVLAMVFVSAPFAVNLAREAFETIDHRLEYAARIHGASRWEAFRRVDLPLAARGILTGGVMAWARAVSEFGAVAVVAYNVEFFYPSANALGKIARTWNPLDPSTWELPSQTAQHAPVFIFNTYTAGSLAESSAVGFILLSISVLIFLLVRWLAYDDGGVNVLS